MAQRSRRLLTVWLLWSGIVPAVPLVAQQPEPSPQPRPAQPEPGSVEPEPAIVQPARIDEAERAAEMLRRLLRLQRGATETPARLLLPVPDPGVAPRESARTGAETTPRVQGAQREAGQQSASQQDPQRSPQAGGDPVDPAARAAEGIRRLLPQTQPPVEDPSLPEPEAPDPRAVEAVAGGAWYRGSLQTRYRFRRTSSDDDNELHSMLRLDLGDEQQHPVTGRIVARGFWDLDFAPDGDVFSGLDESLGESASGYVYEAFADLHFVAALDRLRLGRQSLTETPVFVEFDGITATSHQSARAGLWASGYVGVPVHHFEASTSGDLVAGASVGMAPWQGGRVRVDLMHLQDRTLTFDGVDDLLSLRWWHRFGRSLHLQGQHTWRDGDPRDLWLRGQVSHERSGLEVAVNWRELLTTQRAEVTELDPYFEVLADYEAYRQAGITTTWIGDGVLSAAAGADIRRLSEPATEGPFNHEYDRYWLSPTVRGIGGQDLEATLTGEFWDAGGEEFRSIGGDLRWRPSERLTFTLGSDFALYRYDVFDGRERDHVRDWFLRVRWRRSSKLRVDASVAFEDSEIDRFFALRVGTTWNF